MNRLFLMASAATLPLVVDASLKSVALLVLAAIAGLLMRRSSAAARHMVWLAAVLALLLVPVLSVVLPGWRVLPEWAAVATGKTTPDASGTDNSHGTYAAYESSFPAVVSPMPVLENPVTAVAEAPLPPTTAPAPAPVAVATPLPVPPSSFPGGWFLSAWAAGCALLLLRLSAAHWLLHRAARHSRGTDEPLAGTFAAALKESGVRQQVRLLVDSRRTIPVAWGIFRPRLLLPEEAVSWDEGQLRSVFMHELAHLRRRDPLVQFLTQVACALHWFNPLVWLAAWRLHVERERACDDLVLASGVRPSEYAGHLLHVATQLSPARWTAGCGLAMARKSSLEGRLLAVLSNNLNRRGVTRILAIAAILLGAAIAVPVAMLRAAEKKPAASPDTVAAESPDVSKMQVGEATGMEKNLKWGEPVNGLRAAVAFLATSPTKPKPGDLQELFLALQNVSKAPLRLSDADLGSKDPSRHLYLKVKGEIKFGLGSNTPALGDLTLQPGEIKTLLMFTPVPSKPDGPSIGQLMTEGAVKDTHQTLMMELKIEKAPAGAWTGTLRTGDASAYEAQGQPLPKDKKAQELFNLWLHHTRQNGYFPGGLIARLSEKVNEFIRNNTGDASGDPYAKKMAPIVPRLDATRDWKPFEVVALMDDIAAVTSIPLEVTLWKTTQNSYTRGEPLPPELADAPWGEPQPTGLRMARLLEPRAAEYRLGTPLKVRLLFHNSGKENIVFRTESFLQQGHQAKDAKGEEIKVDSVFWTTLGRPVTFRLAPDEFVEVNTPGIGVGPVGKHDDWRYTRIRVGSWVEAKAGDEVTMTTAPMIIGATNEDSGEVNSSDPSVWWTAFIKYHLTQDLPVPADPEERKHLVYRAGMELFGTPLSSEEIDSFVNDRTPTAIDSLAKRLAKRTDTRPSVGELASGPTKFRVLPADPDAAKKPRTASGAGQHLIGGFVTFGVVTRPDGERIVHEAQLTYSPPTEFDGVRPKVVPPYKVELPDGYNSWAAAWVRDTTVLWISQKGLLRKYDFTDVLKIQETRYEGDKAAAAPVPEAIRDALKAELEGPEKPKPKRSSGGPPASSATPQ